MAGLFSLNYFEEKIDFREISEHNYNYSTISAAVVLIQVV